MENLLRSFDLMRKYNINNDKEIFNRMKHKKLCELLSETPLICLFVFNDELFDEFSNEILKTLLSLSCSDDKKCNFEPCFTCLQYSKLFDYISKNKNNLKEKIEPIKYGGCAKHLCSLLYNNSIIYNTVRTDKIIVALARYIAEWLVLTIESLKDVTEYVIITGVHGYETESHSSESFISYTSGLDEDSMAAHKEYNPKGSLIPLLDKETYETYNVVDNFDWFHDWSTKRSLYKIIKNNKQRLISYLEKELHKYILLRNLKYDSLSEDIIEMTINKLCD